MTTAKDLQEFVLHLPRPTDVAAARRELLVGARYLIVVGSPRRARRIATLAHERHGARLDAAGSCYCDLTVPGRDETGREYAIYVPELPRPDGSTARVAVASHGVGKAGVEIVLSELPAAIAHGAGRRGGRRSMEWCVAALVALSAKPPSVPLPCPPHATMTSCAARRLLRPGSIGSGPRRASVA